MKIGNLVRRLHLPRFSQTKPYLAIPILIMLIGSALGTYKAYSMPETVEKEKTLVSYQHLGKFDYEVYTLPASLFGTSPGETEEPGKWALYFTDLIESIGVTYQYEFIPDDSSLQVTASADIIGIVQGPSRWTKEISLGRVEETGKSLTVSFPLDLAMLDKLVTGIEEELGFRTPGQNAIYSFDMEIQARVSVGGKAGPEIISDTFIQPVAVKVSKGILTWDNELFMSRRKSTGGSSYRHRGIFDYSIKLKPNSLYESDTLKPTLKIPPAPTPLPPSEVTFLRLTDVMKARFGYEFRSEQPVENLSSDVTVTAILEFPSFWKKTFTLVPKTRKSSPFNVEFTVDLVSLNELTSTIKNETGVAPPTYPLTIRADVQTVAETGFGRVSESFSQTLKGELGGSVIMWSPGLTETKSGAITKQEKLPNNAKFLGFSRKDARTLFPSLIGAFFVFGVYYGVLCILFRPLAMPESEKEARRARKKYRGLIADVEEPPEFREGIVISISSLSDLVVLAQGMLKPVLHRNGGKGHTYWVVDGMTCYRYVSNGERKESRN